MAFATDGFPTQRASNAESVSMTWRHMQSVIGLADNQRVMLNAIAMININCFDTRNTEAKILCNNDSPICNMWIIGWYKFHHDKKTIESLIIMIILIMILIMMIMMIMIIMTMMIMIMAMMLLIMIIMIIIMMIIMITMIIIQCTTTNDDDDNDTIINDNNNDNKSVTLIWR